MLQLAAGPGGTAPKAQTIGYSVGGKTGTAYKQEGKGYATDKYRAWFVGMAPVKQPRVVVAVMVDEPRGRFHYGGDVAAPVFSQIVQQTLQMLNVAPDLRRQAAVHHLGALREGELLMAVTPLRSTDAAARWLREWVRGTLRSDSRAVRPGDGFIAWPGHATDGRRFVTSALEAGATTCLVEQEGIEAFGFDDARIASLPQMKATTGLIADAYYDEPSRALDVVAVTGTNGKTSSAWWVAQALTLLGRRCGIVGTLGIGTPPLGAQPGAVVHTGLTTPDPVRLHEALRGFVDQGFAACAMEASSIGIDEQRLAGVRVAVAVFTNFTQDHLDYHGSMGAYWSAKRRLFAWTGLRAAVINVDDAAGAQLAPEIHAQGLCEVWSVGLRGDARLSAREIRYVDGGLRLRRPGGRRRHRHRAQPADRRLQRVQPAGRDRGAAGAAGAAEGCRGLRAPR